MSANELRMRANILSGDYAETDNIESNDDDFGPLQVSDSDDDDIDTNATALKNVQQNRKQRTNNLMYNDSDSEDDQRLPLKLTDKKKPAKKINIFDMIKNNDDNDNSNEQTNQSNADKEPASDDDDDDDVSISRMNRPKKRATMIDSDSEPDDKPEEEPEEVEINTEEFSSQMIRSRLAALEDSDSDAENDEPISRTTVTKMSKNVIGSDESDNENDKSALVAPAHDSPTQLNKRQRSGIEDDDDEIDNDGTLAAARQHKKPRLSIVDDDDDTSE